MTTPRADGDDMTELVDADFPRVDLVGKGANGIPRFLIAKQDGTSAGLMEPEFVRDLIEKAEPDAPGRERVTMPSGVTLSGSPADVAAFIHQAAVAKAEMSSKSINDLPDDAFAFIEPGGKKDAEGKTTPRSLRHFPVHDEAHARNALSRAPQSPFGEKAMPKIRAAARKFGIEVSKESGVADEVAKDMGPELDEGIDGMDPTVPLGAPDGDAPGDPDVPGSPAWEAIDAATAQKWTSILARARRAVDLLAEREMIEAVTADPSDADNACDLTEACCAIDYAISVLAPFAVAEQSEADCAAEAMAMVGKAMAGFDADQLEAVEGLSAVAKSGRVLSSAKEARIRQAAASLADVLQSLPQAPMAGDPVTKEEAAMDAAQTQAQAAPESAEDVAKADAAEAPQEAAETPAGDVAKADGGQDAPEGAEPGDVAKAEDAPEAPLAEPVAKGDAAQVAVYTSTGCLVGVVDPGAITPVMSEPPSADGDKADDGDMTPQPAAEAGTPAHEVAKADDTAGDTTETTPDDVAKAADAGTETITTTQDALESLVAKAVAAALGTQAAAEDIAKADVVAALGEQVETLKAQVVALGEQPAMPKVFTSGATPPAHMMRGQDQARGGTLPPVDVAKAAELKGTLYRGTAAEQNAAALDMQQMAIDRLSAIHGAG